MLRRCRPLLGTFVEVTADREDAIAAAFGAIEQVHRLMSAHEPESDVSKINRTAHVCGVSVHPWTASVLERACSWSEASDGAFDIVRAGRSAIGSGYLPRHDDQPEPQASDWTDVAVDGLEVRLLKPGCIDLGGIAKGFAVDGAVEALRRAGARAGLVNAGGDMAGFGAPWLAHIVEPRTRKPLIEVILEDRALATSALIGGGLRHVPGADPRWTSASVHAPSAMDADALTKILLAGSPVAARCLGFADAEGLRIAQDGAVEAVELVEA